MPLPLLLPVAIASVRILWAVGRFGVISVVKHPVKSLIVGTATTAIVNSDEVIDASNDFMNWTDGMIDDSTEAIDDLENCIDSPFVCFWDTDLGKVIIISSAVYLIYKVVGAK